MDFGADTQAKIAKLIIDNGLVDALRVRILPPEKQNPKAWLDDGLISPQILAHAIAHEFNIPFAYLDGALIGVDILHLVSEDSANKMRAVPLAERDGKVYVALENATDTQKIDYLSNMLHKPLVVYMASPDAIGDILEQYRSDLSVVDNAVEANRAMDDEVNTEVKTIVQDSPIAKALVSLLEYSVKSRASDIHIEPEETRLLVRCRIDGVLREVMNLPKTIEGQLVARIKILAGLKIDEKRAPQDGQFSVKVGDQAIDLRIATSPVVWGEQVVIRILQKETGQIGIEKMGIVGRSLRTIRRGIDQPNGMVITSGPTGSGKSTTLYSLIQEIKSPEINIITLEDPVEYKIAGVNQIQVNPAAGLTFANGLRSILRQDPDVIMVGEIRDTETAQLAVQAALTGHLVFSTLHTNSASGILPRLLDMGIEPFLIASTLNTIIGQRLCRRVAPNAEDVVANDIETSEIRETVGWLLPPKVEDIPKFAEDLGYDGLPLKDAKEFMLRRGRDSEDTPDGYRGRTGVYEALEIDSDVQKLIVAHATASDIQKMAIAKGMITLRQDGMFKALKGITTVQEVNRVTSDQAM
ncbi:MAG: GspE/PulE family protein [Candidatus Nomurabacteria bacterium]|jgi:type IV pilus assembly protein PilB|nr:GspE/PulE family protein [Candidatus Nomurabacteria bacterium]